MRARDQEMHFLLTPEELERVEQKMREAGIVNRSAYFRKMVLDGYVVRLDTADIHKMVSLLRRSSNNLNQIAKKANATSSIYGADIADLQSRQDELWELAKEIVKLGFFISVGGCNKTYRAACEQRPYRGTEPQCQNGLCDESGKDGKRRTRDRLRL